MFDIIFPCFSGVRRTHSNDSQFELGERVHYTRDQLLQLREVVDIPEVILKVKQEVEAEFFGESQNWTKSEGIVPNQPQARYSEPDNRDWWARAPPTIKFAPRKKMLRRFANFSTPLENN
ncbi:hypothetical protein L1987_43260 [Smallanthus sonchifolius]|uniref:Uncharacterized protein n=1 Tax=Smallanthus sonchifolius TaxID=185202 RepID=A0ACB9GMD5_9ASTR|nr:hypothetical protein L1987_43260 [Smallanthus sonchifolius]